MSSGFNIAGCEYLGRHYDPLLDPEFARYAWRRRADGVVFSVRVAAWAREAVMAHEVQLMRDTIMATPVVS